ncbi:MAG: acyl-phosphate glycerol 3-phosphate acyltransferase, partial [Acutalibacter sp.]|nr:acyl-phosphate glycerol 3-phosphate acyltransferase [Acutalibacter sp.]
GAEAPGFELLQAGRYLAGAACVLGHIFPVYYGFRGGKGIVAAAAMILLVDWRVFLLVIGTFLLLFIWKRIISLASVVCAGVYPVYTFLMVFFADFGGGRCTLGYLLFVTGAALFIGVLVLWKHRANIGRLARGEEKPIIGKGK